MKVQIRPATQNDVTICGKIAYLAFKSIADQHNFPPDFPSVEDAVGVVSAMVASPRIYGIVAEAGARVLGSNFMDERASIAGIGPISVDPEVQNSGAGRQMMEHMLAKVAAERRPGVRLVQTAYHNRSLSLYAKLGFEIREPLSVMQGDALAESFAGYRVRAATRDDVGACNRLCFDVHGFDRGGELLAAIGYGSATVVEHLGRITGYATMLGIGGHAVGESNHELKALIAAARSFGGPGVLVPSRNGELLRWCFSKGLRLTQQMTLMSVGLYNEPKAPFLPSILL
ncbi:MAG: GNAT family N-acetyltransferase [Candidatus Binatus sp.]|uniref:GNAT family N-acetyltransferase n=1 Tax=Candidatus Binatus sp. TaxID=2811406 RepID=UPI002717D92F|nr:GNAT family N-acetyltransferase [Candidatus Binatus sp.]MDO8434250.1 GNAT family N-acetyltransferase [Candidatus Binatus sp.]